MHELNLPLPLSAKVKQNRLTSKDVVSVNDVYIEASAGDSYSIVIGVDLVN